MTRSLLSLFAVVAVVASVIILAADPKPSSTVTTQMAGPQTPADHVDSGGGELTAEPSHAVAQPSAESVAVSSDSSDSAKSPSSVVTATATTSSSTTPTSTTPTTTTAAAEPTSTSLASEALEVDFVGETDPKADTAPTTTAGSTANSEEGLVYIWYDGDRAQRVRLQSGLAAQSGSDGRGTEIVTRGVNNGSQAQQEELPVFRSESTGGLMTLPGGVLVLFVSGLSDAQINEFFKEQGISKNRVSPMLLDNAFEIETEPGFASLELANRLATSDELLVASPNWSFNAVTK